MVSILGGVEGGERDRLRKWGKESIGNRVVV